PRSAAAPDPGPPGPAQRAGRSDTLHGMLCKQGALTPASGGRSKTQAVGSGRFAVLDDELDRLPAPVVVRGQPVGEAVARRGRLAGPATEVDRGQRRTHAVGAQPQLEVALADGLPVEQFEHAVEQRFGKALPPGAAVADRL